MPFFPPQGSMPQPLSRYTGGRPDSNPSARLAEIRSKIVVVERRIRDLEALLTEIILFSDVPGQIQELDSINGSKLTFQYVDGGSTITTADPQAVRDELYRARAEEGELRTSEQFWQQVVQANKEAEKDTHDLFKRA